MFALIQLVLANRRILGYTLVIIGLCGTLWLVHHLGYRDGSADTKVQYELAMQKESDRLRVANIAALQEAVKRSAILMKIIEARNDDIARMQAEAEADPSANDDALSLDSVRRLNRIR